MVDYQKGKIYKLVNNFNKMVYIGSTCSELRLRLQGHKNAKNVKQTINRKLYKDFKNKPDGFKILLIELYPCNSKMELEKREYEILQKFINELGRDKLYNIMLSRSGEGHPFYGLPKEKHPFFGKTLSNEAKEKISKANLGNNRQEKHIRFKRGCVSLVDNKRYEFRWNTYDENNQRKQNTECFSFSKYNNNPEEAFNACLNFQNSIFPLIN